MYNNEEVYYDVETMDEQFVASDDNKEEAVRKARAKAPGERLIGIIRRKSDHGDVAGFYIGDLPAGMPL